jgi:hypothetical protein
MRGTETGKKHLTILLVFFALTSALNVYAVNAQADLRIAMLGSKDVHIIALEPLDIWVEIENLDSSGHFYKIRLDFESYTIDQSGYVAGGDFDVVYFTVVPIYSGNSTILAMLWQDAYDGGSGIDQETKSVIVEKSYMQTQLDDLSDVVQSLQAENSRLSDTLSMLTYGTVALVVIVFVVGFAVWWLNKRKLSNAISNKS